MAIKKNKPSESPAANTAGLRKRAGKKRFKFPLAPFLLLIPWFIGIAVFRAYPIARSFYLSLSHFHILDPSPTFIGFGNYVRMFANDPLFIASSVATLRFVFIGTPVVLVVAFFIAYVLNFKLKGVNLFRTAYYIPSILGGNVAVAILWLQMFRNNGLVNAALGIFGIDPIMWLRSETFAPFVLVMLSAWQFGSTMLIFLAGLQNVSPSLYGYRRGKKASAVDPHHLAYHYPDFIVQHHKRYA
jgi:oligogalacturonide transport system permease protein